jgi:hypothetical protein
MNLSEYAIKIAKTNRDDWNIITCWGWSAGPSFLDRTPVLITGESNFPDIEIESHGMRASLKPDLSIGIAWGLCSNPDFKEPWANQFPDPSASSEFIDFFYNGNLVFRDIYVSVDAGRCRLPLPEREFDSKTNKVLKYTVSRDRYEFFKMFDGLEQISDFDRYFKQAGFVIVDFPWMI